MKLIYDATERSVQKGDTVKLDGISHTILSFSKPPRPEASGKVYLSTSDGKRREYYVGVIGATWIEREDRAALLHRPVSRRS